VLVSYVDLSLLERRVLCRVACPVSTVVSLGTLPLFLSLAACTACMRTSRRPPTALLHQHSVDSAFAGKQITIQAGQSFIDRPGGVSQLCLRDLSLGDPSSVNMWFPCTRQGGTSRLPVRMA